PSPREAGRGLGRGVRRPARRLGLAPGARAARVGLQRGHTPRGLAAVANPSEAQADLVARLPLDEPELARAHQVEAGRRDLPAPHSDSRPRQDLVAYVPAEARRGLRGRRAQALAGELVA